MIIQLSRQLDWLIPWFGFMEKEKKNYGSYDEISNRILERIKRFASDGDFEKVLSGTIDLTEGDKNRLDRFLEEPKIQRKLSTKFEELAIKIVESQEIPENISEQVDNVFRMYMYPEARKRQNIQSLLKKLRGYALENDDNYDYHKWRILTS